ISEGLLDIVPEGHAFLRSPSNDYMPSLEDTFVPPSLVQQYDLREGMTLRGDLRPGREGEVLYCLRTVTEIDGGDPEDARGRTPFKELTPIYPEERFLLEGTPGNPLEM